MAVPPPFDDRFAKLLQATKQDFVVPTERGTEALIDQHGCALVEPAITMPPWPDLNGADQVIETYVVDADGGRVATNDREFCSTAWGEIADWFIATVLDALRDHGVTISGSAFLTASVMPTAELEGLPHLDDDMYVPDDNVGFVAIMGQHDGPRVARTPLPCNGLRPMGQLVYDDTVLDAFAARTTPVVSASADQIVVFPQFGQLHAGPTTQVVSPAASTRQLLVLRARADT